MSRIIDLQVSRVSNCSIIIYGDGVDGDGDDGDGDDGVDMWAAQGRYPDQFPTAGAAAALNQSQPSKELSHFDNDILIRQSQFY